MADTKQKYPRREPFFAYRFCRLLTKSAAAQELGAGTCWMLTIVAHQEDAKRYVGPVTYWNEQLMPLCGFGSKGTLMKARQMAVDAGWLHYEPGGKGKPGKYWVDIPVQYSDMPDGPCDESLESRNRTANEPTNDEEPICGPEIVRQVNQKPYGKRTRNRTANEPLSTLTLNPIPNPKDLVPDGPSEQEAIQEESVGGVQQSANPILGQCTEEQAFLAAWNSTPGVLPYRKPELSWIRRKEFLKCLASPDWEWREALKKFPLKVQGRPDAWMPNIKFFLKEDSVENILDGVYDFVPSEARSRGQPQSRINGPGATYDPTAAQRDPNHGKL